MDALSLDLRDGVKRAKIEALQWQLSQYLLILNQSVIIEWRTWGRSERDELRVGARALGAEVELYYLFAPVEVLFDRIIRRGMENPPFEREELERCVASFQPPTDEAELYDKFVAM